MSWIKAIHYVPEFKLMKFIISANSNFRDLFHLLSQNNKTVENFEHIDL